MSESGETYDAEIDRVLEVKTKKIIRIVEAFLEFGWFAIYDFWHPTATLRKALAKEKNH